MLDFVQTLIAIERLPSNMEDPTMPNSIGYGVRPVVETLTSLPFLPITEVEIPGWGIATKPPPGLTQRFDSGVHAVLVDSLELAELLPDHGGSTSALFSLLPHQDDSRGGQLQILTLSKLTLGTRASATVLMMPSTAFALLPDEEALFAKYRQEIGREREYDPRFPFSEAQYNRCFDDANGYQRTLGEYREKRGNIDFRTARLNMLDYLIRGPTTDLIMSKLKEKHGHLFLYIRLSYGQVLFIKNDDVFHARDGVGEKLKRNFCTGWK